jgi:hypothetical protein
MLQQITPVYIPIEFDSSGSGSVDNKIMLGIWIVLNLLWLISLAITFVVYLYDKMTYGDSDSFLDQRYRNGIIGEVANICWDFFMLATWAVVGIIYAGHLIADYLNI